MLQLEGAVENLANAVTQIDQFGAPVTNKFYWLEDFRDPAKAPPDLAANAQIGGNVSLGWPVWIHAPGLDRASVEPTIRKLAALQPLRRDLYRRVAAMIASPDNDMYALPDGNANAAATVAAGPSALASITFGFTNGLGSMYPGWDGVPDDYDPRAHHWYLNADGKVGPQWGEPYESPLLRRRVLPLSVPLYDNDHHFLGVVGAMLVPELIVRSMLDMVAVASVRGVFLIDRSGHVLASSGTLLDQQELKPDAADAAVFPQADIVRRVKAHETGIVEARMRNHAYVFAASAVDPMGWSVVAVADPAQLFETK